MSIRLEPIEDGGFAVFGAGFVGFVYPDWFGGWRPYSIYGRCLTAGYPAHFTPILAAHWTGN